MKKIYFLSNNLISNVNIIYPKNTTFNEVRENVMLSIKGEEVLRDIIKNKELDNIEVIYSSPYFSSLDTSKYIATLKKLDIYVDNRLKERLVGNLQDDEYGYLKGMQEHDFNYKLINGESLNEVMNRMIDFLKDILLSDYENILVVTHNIALLSLLLKWCNKDYSLEDRLILDYKENIIFDSSFYQYDLLEFIFDKNKLLGIKRISNIDIV
jgi:broad specificity phosphatase PhoE